MVEPIAQSHYLAPTSASTQQVGNCSCAWQSRFAALIGAWIRCVSLGFYPRVTHFSRQPRLYEAYSFGSAHRRQARCNVRTYTSRKWPQHWGIVNQFLFRETSFGRYSRYFNSTLIPLYFSDLRYWFEVSQSYTHPLLCTFTPPTNASLQQNKIKWRASLHFIYFVVGKRATEKSKCVKCKLI